ncbi:MAG: ankyrin repeat domain-containing protein [Smithella sp.]|jgi:ankyrin repeat protein/RNA polymerase subunit RPABC4/transcription elongation factor Spt4
MTIYTPIDKTSKQTPCCLKCDKILSTEAKYCTNCGGNEFISQYDRNELLKNYDYRHRSVKSIIASVKEAYEMLSQSVFCNKCGEIYDDSYKFCEKCGSAIQILDAKEIVYRIKKVHQAHKLSEDWIKVIIENQSESILRTLNLDGFVLESEYKKFKQNEDFEFTDKTEIISDDIVEIKSEKQINYDSIIDQDGFRKILRCEKQTNNESIVDAALNGDINLIKRLLDNGADIEAKDKHGRTALLLATGKGHMEIVKLLLDKGANIEQKDDLSGAVALTYAASKGHMEIVKLLIDRGANIEQKDDGGSSALMAAASKGHMEIVKLLIDRGVNVQAKSNRGYSALSLAESWKHKDTVALLKTKINQAGNFSDNKIDEQTQGSEAKEEREVGRNILRNKISHSYSTNEKEHIYITPNISEVRITNFLNQVKRRLDINVHADSVLAFHDNTLLGSGKDGMAVTNERVINISGISDHKWWILLSEIQSIETSRFALSDKIKINTKHNVIFEAIFRKEIFVSIIKDILASREGIINT